MNKLLPLIIACALILSILVACNKQADTPPATTSKEQTPLPQPSASTAGTQTPLPQPSASTVETENSVKYPITVQHARGETVIESKPERIVTLAWGNHDVPLALGVVPVGLSEANWGVSDGSGLLPWTKERIAELGGKPVVFKDTDGFDFEAINEVQPDVILAAASGITEEEYQTLSKIAPTIPYPGLAWQTSWRDQVYVNSKGMGMEEEGRQLVREVDALIVQKVAQYPELAGKTAAFAWIDAANLSVIYIYTPTDTRPAFLQDLGFAIPENVRKLAENSNEFYITISSENADLFSDVDILVTYQLSDDSLEAMQVHPLLGQVPAIKNGSIVTIPENALSAAISPTILSIPWALDEYVQLLAEAARKVGE